jgi:4'-phosphopantetheinyl transferase
MPLFKTIIHDKSTKILVWKIDESLEQLFENIILTDKSKNRINGMKSEIHKRAFLCVRKLLALENYSDSDLIYDETGKPYLIDNKHISISHSHQFATIIISDIIVGIDIEMEREKIILIADKFTNKSEKVFLATNKIKKLTTIWGAKEAVFKMVNQKGISFKDHLFVKSFKISDKKTTILLKTENINQEFLVFFEEIEEFILVFSSKI